MVTEANAAGARLVKALVAVRKAAAPEAQKVVAVLKGAVVQAQAARLRCCPSPKNCSRSSIRTKTTN
jgi:hypothetical protein